MQYLVVAAYAVMISLIAATFLYRRFLSTPSPIRTAYRPKAALFVPVRGVDPEFRKNVDSLFDLDYPDYEVIFAVADRNDEAYDLLVDVCARHAARGRIVIAGLATRCSDKIHNLLTCYRETDGDCEVFVVVDADIQLHRLLLKKLITALADPEVGVATGYRWLVAKEPTLARTVATMTNAAGAVSFWLSNNVWGGTLAIRRATFETLEVPAVWDNALSDDLTLRRLLRRHRRRVVAISDGLAVSHQDYDWATYWEFLVRQLIIVRVYAPALWWQVAAFYSLTIPVAVYGAVGSLAWVAGLTSSAPLIGLPLSVLFAFQGWLVIDGAQRAVRRRGESIPTLGVRHLPVYWLALVVGVLQLAASSTRRWIVWRGVLYRMHGRDRTDVVRSASAAHG